MGQTQPDKKHDKNPDRQFLSNRFCWTVTSQVDIFKAELGKECRSNNRYSRSFSQVKGRH